MSRIAELLREFLKVPNTSDETINAIEAISELKTYHANDIVYREHAVSRHLFIVVSGQIDVQYLLTNGRRKTLDSCGTGDMLLWSAVIEPHETNSIGICRAESELLTIDGQKLLEICEKDAAFGYRMMSRVASVIRRRLQASRVQMYSMKE